MLQRRFVWVLSLTGVGCLLCAQVLPVLRNYNVQLEVQTEVNAPLEVQTEFSRVNNNHKVVEVHLHKEEEEKLPEITTTSTMISPHIDLPPQELQIPKLIVGGAQKGGTTALWAILQRQPSFVPIKKKWPGTREAHFFDREIVRNETWNGVPNPEWKAFQQNMNNNTVVAPTIVQALRNEYANHWGDLKRFNSKVMEQGQSSRLITLEKTPEYMIAHHVPALVKKVTPWVKMLFIVRDPVSRAYSMWKMYHSKKKLKTKSVYSMAEDFEHYVQLEVESLRLQGVSQAPTLQEFNHPNFRLNASSFAIPHTIAQRRLLRDVHSEYTMLYRGMYAELLSAWTEQDFRVDNQNLLVVSHEHFSQNHLGVVHAIQQFVGAPTTDISAQVLERNYHKSSKKSAVQMEESTQRYLELFFQPYNEELKELMGKAWYSKHVGKDWTGKVVTDSINDNVA